MTLRRCVFVGPSLSGFSPPSTVDFFSPASLGAIYKAYQEGYRLIGIVDGIFGDVPSVWHKEILHVIKNGATVVGAASMGALRASELDRCGMTGIGSIYRLCKRGSIMDDDEVCVLHGPAELEFVPLTIAMIDIRLTLRQLRRQSHITYKQECSINKMMKDMHFSERTSDVLLTCIRQSTQGLWTTELDQYQCLKNVIVSLKRIDAERLVDYLANNCFKNEVRTYHNYVETENWRKIYQEEYALIPNLEKWRSSL